MNEKATWITVDDVSRFVDRNGLPAPSISIQETGETMRIIEVDIGNDRIRVEPMK